MTNVVSLNQVASGSAPTDSAPVLSTFDKQWETSPLNFHAYERPLWYEGRERNYNNTGHKALVRPNGNLDPICLNVVRDTYKVVQNKELFEMIHEGLFGSGVTQNDIDAARINDKISYGGSQCFREYIFPTVAFDSPEKDKIAFRIIIQNGFGTGAIKLYAGAIDFFCTNGLIHGEYTSTYAKHTKGLQLSKFTEAVQGAVAVFWKNKGMFDDLSSRSIKHIEDKTIRDWLIDKFNERLGEKLFRQFLIEAQTRGRTLWALYSALTYYSSHAEGEFSLRNTGNDHFAATMMKRENDVRRVVRDGQELLKLVA